MLSFGRVIEYLKCSFALKQDHGSVDELRQELASQRSQFEPKVVAQFVALRGEIVGQRSQIEALRSELVGQRSQIEALRGELALLRSQTEGFEQQTRAEFGAHARSLQCYRELVESALKTPLSNPP